MTERSQSWARGEDIAETDAVDLHIVFTANKGSDRFVKAGWSAQEETLRWMTGAFSIINLPITSIPGERLLLMRIAPYIAEGKIAFQRCTVICGVHVLAQLEVRRAGWIGVRLPTQVTSNQQSLGVTFVHTDGASPLNVGTGLDSRILAIAVQELIVTAPETEVVEIGRNDRAIYGPHDLSLEDDGIDWQKTSMLFQSLGQNCEFGIFQRNCGAEPFGLFRFSSTSLGKVIDGLLDRFATVNDPDKLHIGLGPKDEYFGRHSGLGLEYHTFLSRLDDGDPAAIQRAEVSRLVFLVRKLIEDLSDGRQIFVLQRPERLEEFEILPLLFFMRRFCPETPLLWIVEAGPDEQHWRGKCELRAPNLLRGYLDHLVSTEDWTDFSLETWKDVCLSALAALGRRPVFFSGS